MFLFYLKRFYKLKITQLKTHQVGTEHFEELQNQDDTTVQEKSLVEENRRFIIKIKDSNEAIGGTQLDMQNSSSISEEETVSEFANSRTIIKP